jgi:hypothetical protein
MRALDLAKDLQLGEEVILKARAGSTPLRAGAKYEDEKQVQSSKFEDRV